MLIIIIGAKLAGAAGAAAPVVFWSISLVVQNSTK